ncbi:hypothetical protein K2Z84_17900 [Candidatus Binatia bacterium]|nr:hypothetical protein [Candidatus Binatia bacterium]
MQPMHDRPAERFRLFAPLPVSGPWTALGLSRGQFLAILVGACLIYLFLGGPLWAHLRQNDFVRISVSYLAIPLAVAVAQRHNGTLKLATWFAASGVVASLKLLITAGIAVALGISH